MYPPEGVGVGWFRMSNIVRKNKITLTLSPHEHVGEETDGTVAVASRR